MNGYTIKTLSLASDALTSSGWAGNTMFGRGARTSTLKRCGNSIAAIAAAPLLAGAVTGASQEKVVYSFGASGQDGTLPQAGLIPDNHGNFFGTTPYGGANQTGGALGSGGTIFELSPSSTSPTGWIETVLWSFPENAADGCNPMAGLVFDKDYVDLYGTTSGSDCGTGTAFELSPQALNGGAWTEKVLWNFGSSFGDGTNPQAGLLFDPTYTHLYGTANQGGSTADTYIPFGTVFEMGPAANGNWPEQTLFTFGLNDGASPQSGLVVDGEGNLYGTTPSGGYGFGVVFKLAKAAGGWTETVLYKFDESNTGEPLQPAGGLLLYDGNLYGTASSGGANGKGAVFELSPSAASSTGWEFATLYSFGSNFAHDGNQPMGGLIVDANGNLAGTTYGGGANNQGTAFELVPPASTGGTWTETVLHNFGSGSDDGSFPYDTLASDAAGDLFGTTSSGGANDLGTVFTISHSSLHRMPRPPACPTPTFLTAGGIYAPGVTVKVADAKSGAAIYYTTNGTTPTDHSTSYTAAGITVTATETIKVIAYAAGDSPSPVVSETYTIEPPAAKPTFTPATGKYVFPLTVKIADATPRATIYYTTNGKTPTTSSAKYTAAGVKVSAAETIEAIAVATGHATSAVAIADYTMAPAAAKPKFTPAAGRYTSPLTVKIADSTPHAVIYYTTNGKTPTTSSTKYPSAGIKVAASETIEAIAVATGYSDSAPAAATYTIQ